MSIEKQFNWHICGQEKIIDFLQSAILNDRVAHGYLFVGPANLGKYAVAKEFIGSILCQGQPGPMPCGECFHCRQFKNGLHPDVYIVERIIDDKTGKLKKDIAIDQIRDLKSRLQQATFLNSYKIAIIPEAQYFNKNTANALLKILEEPTNKTVIILIADDANKLPQTIISRCQVLKFLPVAAKKINDYLMGLDGFSGFDGSEAKLLARLSQGKPGRAISFLQNRQLKEKYLGDINNFFKLTKADFSARFKTIEEIIDWHKDDTVNIKQINNLFDNWQSILRDILLVKSENEPLVANINFFEAINKNKELFSFNKIQAILAGINQARTYLKQNINTKSVLENLIINL